MAAKATTPKAATKKAPQAHFVVFDRQPQGSILVETIKTPVSESGLIADTEMEKLRAHDSVRNRIVQCVNAHAMTAWKPWTKNEKVVLTPNVIVKAYELLVEKGVELDKLHFELRDELGVEVTLAALKNMLQGKTHKTIKVPRQLREKYAQMVAKKPQKEAKGGTPVETRVKIILKVLCGDSGGTVAKEFDLTSSTVNTMVRQFRGLYRDGNPIDIDKLPAWVAKARKLVKEEIENGDYNIKDEFKSNLNLS